MACEPSTVPSLRSTMPFSGFGSEPQSMAVEEEKERRKMKGEKEKEEEKRKREKGKEEQKG